MNKKTISLFISTALLFNISLIDTFATNEKITIQAENFINVSKDYNGNPTVAVGPCEDKGKGKSVGWIDSGDWMEYKINIKKSSYYTFRFRIAGNGGQINVGHGPNELTRVTLPYTGGWQTWKRVVSPVVYLNSGVQVISIYAAIGGFNINRFSIGESNVNIFSSPNHISNNFSKLIWQDEFNGTNNSIPNNSKWLLESGGHGWGNNELQYYTNRNSFQRNGNLVIQVRKEQFTGPDGVSKNYTSARLNSKFSFKYGKVEARVKIPSGQGLWPAFWMLGQDLKSGTVWPNCGEIDIMELIGSKTNEQHTSVHGPGYSGSNPVTQIINGPDFSKEFHTFGIVKSPNKIEYYIDNNIIFQVTPDTLPPGTQWVFERDFYILLNVAVGGTWPGNPSANLKLPAEMLVDYVRVYGE